MDKAAHPASAAELSGKAGMKDDMTLMSPFISNKGLRGVEANTARSKGTPMGAPTGVTEIQYDSARVPVVDSYDTYEDEE
jgi:hypothetical protein